MRIFYLFAVFVLLLALVGCEEKSPNQPEKIFDASLYQGVYLGTWTNLTTGASDSAKLIIELVESSSKASLTLDFDGNYLGLDDPPPATLTGTYDKYGAKVKGTSPLFGDYDVTIDVDGKIVGVMKNLAGGAIPEMTYTGTLTADSLDADYVVKFADGRMVNSILRMKKQK